MKGSVGTSGPGVGGKMSSGSMGCNSIETGSRSPMISMPRTDTKIGGPQINIKNGVEGPQKHATDSALRFKAEGAKPLINLEQKGVKLEAGKIDIRDKAVQKKYNQASNIRLAYARQELGKIALNPESNKLDFVKPDRTQTVEVASKRSPDSRQKVHESYLKMVGKYKPEKQVTSEANLAKTNEIKAVMQQKAQDIKLNMIQRVEAQRQAKDEKNKQHQVLENKSSIQLSSDVKKARITEIRTIASAKVKEALAKMKQRVELRRSKTSSKTETKLAPMTTEKYQQVLTNKVQTQVEAKLAKATSQPNNKTEVETKTHVKAEVAAQPALQTEVKTQAKVQTETKPEAKPQTKTDKKTVTKTKADTQSLVQEEVDVEVKRQEAQVESEKMGYSGQAETKKTGEGSGSNKKYVYFEVDEKTKRERADALEKAHKKAKSFVNHMHGRENPNGQEVAAFLDPIKNKNTESESIDRLDDDGTASKLVDYVAQQNEIVRIDELNSYIADNFNPSRLIRVPNNRVLSKSEVQQVHNGKRQFEAWMEGRIVLVNMEDDTVKAA